MITVYFQNSSGDSREIGNCKTLSKVTSVIKKFLKQKKFKMYYMRSWEYNNKTWFDVGSHSEFFWIEGNRLNEYLCSVQK